VSGAKFPDKFLLRKMVTDTMRVDLGQATANRQLAGMSIFPCLPERKNNERIGKENRNDRRRSGILGRILY
jgi:hypothetical protein